MAENVFPRKGEFASALLTRQSGLASVRSDYEGLWKDVIEFVNLRRYNLDNTQQKGKKAGTSIFNSVAVDALRDLADGLFGYLISPAMQWFKLRISNEPLMAIPSIKLWLEETEWAMYTALQRSNFYEVMPEYFQDGGSIGTATIYSEEDIAESVIVFTVCHPGEVWISEDKYGRVDTVFRRFNYTARQAVRRFGESSGLSTNLITNFLRPGGADTPYEFYHVVQPNADLRIFFNPDSGLAEPRLSPTNKPFVSYYVQKDGPTLVSESGYLSNPFQVWRWRKNSEEVYGRSPASDAIVDVLMANQMSKTLINAAHQAVEPPLNVPAELRGKVRITPRGMNYYEDAARTISPILTRMDYPVGADREKRVEDAVRKHFMTEFFTLLSRAAMDGRQLNVPQVLEMQGEKAVMLGTVVGRLISDCFDPLVDRVFQIEWNAGRIPPPPDILVQQMGGSRITVHYMGPLAQAQRRLFRTQGIYQSLQALAPIAEIRPDIYDNVDLDAVSREIMEATGLSAKVIRDPRVVERERSARARQIMAEKQANMVMQMAQQVPNLSKAPEEGSPVDAIAKAGR